MACQTDKKDEIDVSMLNVGDCISYKKICELTNQPYCYGDQKKKQLRNFERYFSYDKEKTKYIITDIYNEPLEAEYKYPHNTVYTELIEKILLHYLSTQPGYKVYISSTQLWYQLGIVNGYFLKYKNEHKKLVDLNPTMTLFEINDFYKRCWSKFSTIITNSFKSLANQKLIESHKVYRIGIKETDKCGIECIVFHDASELEEKEILKVQRQVLIELGLSSIKQIGYSKKSRDFYEITSQMYKELYGWDGVYKFYKIIYNREDVIDAISRDEADEKKKFLNEKIMAALETNANYNYDKAGLTSNSIQDVMFDNNGVMPEGVFYYPEKYLDKQKWLSSTLVKLRDVDDINIDEFWNNYTD